MVSPRGSRDAGEKRRAYKGPALFSFGFRPFFLGATLFGGLAVPLWMAAFSHGYPLGPGGFAMGWHAHEMIFGFLAAVVAGFLLTAVPNWTGRAPVMGWPLALVFGTWLLGRIVMLVPEPGVPGKLLDCMFLLVFAGLTWREVLTGRNWKNLPVCGMLTVFALANVAWHIEVAGGALPAGFGQRLALGVVTLLMAYIGGRIIPSFTTNWMKKQGLQPLPSAYDGFDLLVLLATMTTMLAWVAAPFAHISGWLLASIAMLHLIRMARWQGWRTRAEPLVLILHIAYAWIVVALAFFAADVLVPGLFAAASALHALTAGAIGQLTLAVMTRASLGHLGRPLSADRTTIIIYVLVFAGASLRLLLPFTPIPYTVGASIAGVTWAAGLLLFAATYGPLLIRPRAS